MSLRRRAWVGTVAALALAASGALSSCSSSDSLAASACGTPGIDGRQINLGLLYPDSGPVSGIFDVARAGIDARLGVANAAGGVGGRRVVYEWRDDAGVDRTNESAARELVEQRQVFGVIEMSVASIGSAAYLTSAGIPVSGMATNRVWATSRNMFAATSVSGTAIETQGRFVQAQGGHRAVIVQPALSEAQSMLGRAYVAGLAAAGVTTVETMTFSTGIDDPAAAARRIAATRADAIISVLPPGDLIAILTALRGGGYAPRVVLSASGYDHTLLEARGSEMAGISIPVSYRPFELGGQGITDYVDAMRRFAPQVPQPQHDVAVAAYVSTDIFLRGLALAGRCPTRESFIAGLRAANSYDAGGLISPISFRPGAASTTECLAFVQANATGRGFVVVEPNLCGRAMTP